MEAINLHNCVIHLGDCIEILKTLPSESVQTCVTSPPYFGLRNYEHDGQIGIEMTPGEYVERLVRVFSEVRRILRPDGTLWLNLGDTYGERKQLLMIPARTALALQDDGWILRQDIIWSKPNPMPEGSVRDRCTKAHEYIYLFSKNERYYYDGEAIKEDSTELERPQRRRALDLARKFQLTDEHLRAIRACGATDVGKNRLTQDGFGKNAKHVQELADEAKAVLGGYYREFTFSDRKNRRSVWAIPAKPYNGAHLAVFPPRLPELCIKAGSRIDDVVLDPFNGSGTTAHVALTERRRYVGIEINPNYVDLTLERLQRFQSSLPNHFFRFDNTDDVHNGID